MLIEENNKKKHTCFMIMLRERPIAVTRDICSSSLFFDKYRNILRALGRRPINGRKEPLNQSPVPLRSYFLVMCWIPLRVSLRPRERVNIVAAQAYGPRKWLNAFKLPKNTRTGTWIFNPRRRVWGVGEKRSLEGALVEVGYSHSLATYQK